MNKENMLSINVVNFNKAILKFDDLIVNGFIGINGSSENKAEGDKKTPIGEFDIGLIFGTHNREELNLSDSLKYIRITDSMYWVCDSYSRYYNQLVDSTFERKEWRDAEHLIDYQKEYEYAIEIKTNPYNIPNKGSAIFLHCGNSNTSRLCCNR